MLSHIARSNASVIDVCGASPLSDSTEADVPSFLRWFAPKPNALSPPVVWMLPAPDHSAPSTPDSKVFVYTCARAEAARQSAAAGARTGARTRPRRESEDIV